VVDTHDLEVLDLLDGSYASYHFREETDCGAPSFDFRVRPGPASTRNAIALLQLMEYPDDVVRDALRALESVPRLPGS
jgi:DNA mismatch repair ATPase MutS